jgi:16S rRNA (guanine527-N7)-methyltransferase
MTMNESTNGSQDGSLRTPEPTLANPLDEECAAEVEQPADFEAEACVVDAPPSESLQQAVELAGIELSPAVIEGVEAYCHVLWEWNKRLNLTRHTTYDLFVRRDLLDTLRLAAHVKESAEVLDIGTGGGVPGVLLAILRPDLTVSVCDSVKKKATAVSGIIGELELPVAVYAVRAQEVLEDMRFHTLVTRAAGSICQLMTWLKDHWMSFDELLAIKGPRWVEERKEARHRGLLNGIELRRVEGYVMPGTKNESVILRFQRDR